MGEFKKSEYAKAVQKAKEKFMKDLKKVYQAFFKEAEELEPDVLEEQ